MCVSDSNLVDWRDAAACFLFEAASRLTDPVCKAHEFFRRICVVKEGSWVSHLARKVALFIGMIGWAFLALFGTLPGMALRSFGSMIQEKPFIHMKGEGDEKILPPDGTFSLLSWNVCCVGGGYSISDGGVVPWSLRIDQIIDKICEKNADVNCLYETFDTKSAFYIAERLKERGYAHLYFNIGPKTVGVSSGILVASKYKIQNSEFVPFPEDTLVGRTKSAVKGVFAFDLESGGRSFARVYATHLQHSEEPEFPTAEEVEGRKKQMGIILEHLVKDRPVVVTGDLNLDDAEFNGSDWKSLFVKGDDFVGKTWGGDHFCAQLVGKPPSGPLNLDHTMAQDVREIHTTLLETGYDARSYKEEALSDHEGLFSLISVEN